MSDPIRVGHLYTGRIQPGAVPYSRNQQAESSTHGLSFGEMLQDRLLHFSNHAVKRLEQRGIEIKPEELSRIESAIDSAAAKGAKETLILMKDTALIVNVNNRTVVTALSGNSMKDNVFTQIDSAVIIS